MSQNIRATPCSAGRHGRIANVVGSGIAIMSDSSIALKPVIEEPSNPIPPSNASASSVALIENDFSWPRMSVNHRRMKRISRSSTSARTSSAVVRSGVAIAGAERYLSRRWLGSARRVCPGRLAGRSARSWTPACDGLGASAWPRAGARTAPARARGPSARARTRPAAAARGYRPLDDPAGLELLHPLGQQPVGELRDRLRHLGEAQRAVHQDAQDRAGPAAPDQLDRLVVVGAAAAGCDRVLGRARCRLARGRTVSSMLMELTPPAAPVTPRSSRRPAPRRRR